MILEYILLLSAFAMIMFGTLMHTGSNSLIKAGPFLGARIERNLVTGNGFKLKDGSTESWLNP